MLGAATVALNHGVIPRIIATDRAASWKFRWPGDEGSITPLQAWLFQPRHDPVLLRERYR
jgi:hypothetical protein